MRKQLVLSPVPSPAEAQQGQERQPLEHTAGKTIGFLNTFWDAYKPLVEELGRLLQERAEVGATPRADYGRRPRLKEVWAERKDWVRQLDAAVVGVGA